MFGTSGKTLFLIVAIAISLAASVGGYLVGVLSPQVAIWVALFLQFLGTVLANALFR